MENVEREIKRWLPYRLQKERKAYKKPLSISEIIDIFNKDSGMYSILEMFREEAKNGVGNPEQLKRYEERYKSEMVTLEHTEIIKETLNKDSLYFSDFKFYDDTFKRIEYEPFTTTFETSGKVIIENDLRSFFKEKEEDFNVNATSGIVKTMDFYAQQGMLHGFVGNSCPGIFLSEKHGQINIGADYNYDTDEELLPDESYKRITSVCTDLWWYSIVDLEHFKKLNPEVDTSNFDIVEIPAGTWELSHKYGVSENGYHENLPYATLTLQTKRKSLIEKNKK